MEELKALYARAGGEQVGKHQTYEPGQKGRTETAGRVAYERASPSDRVKDAVDP